MSVPSGFYEKVTCESYDAAFVRGVLLTPAFIAEHEARRGRGSAFFDLVSSYPRWTLYGGPVRSTLEAQRLATRVGQWAQQYGYDWYINPVACIVASDHLAWPRTDFRWEWVWETRTPLKVEERWTDGGHTYVYA